MMELIPDIALGMMPAIPWNRIYEANGGYINIKKNKNVLCYCYHIYNRNKQHLYNNTRFETQSKSKHHFGVIEEIIKSIEQNIIQEGMKMYEPVSATLSGW